MAIRSIRQKIQDWCALVIVGATTWFMYEYPPPLSPETIYAIWTIGLPIAWAIAAMLHSVSRQVIKDLFERLDRQARVLSVAVLTGVVSIYMVNVVSAWPQTVSRRSSPFIVGSTDSDKMVIDLPDKDDGIKRTDSASTPTTGTAGSGGSGDPQSPRGRPVAPTGIVLTP